MSAPEMAHLRAAACAAVRRAAALARGVQAAFGAADALAKADASPVTVGDLGVQAVVALSLRTALSGGRAVCLLAEEDAATFRRGGAALVARVVAAVNAAYPKPEARRDAAAAAGGGDAAAVGAARAQLLGGGDSWTEDDVADAIAAGELGAHAAAQGGGGGSYFVLDPIDGTKGYVRGAAEPGAGHQYCVGLAYVRDGVPVIGVLGCPALPFPALSRRRDGGGGGGSDEAAAGAGAGARGSGSVGTLFSAQVGCGATQEPLGAHDEPAGAEPTRTPVHTGALAVEADAAGAVLCESFETAHSDHALSAAVARHLGIRAPAVRLDSMCKYGLLARGDGHVYLRFPRPGYVEWVWDHAAGLVVLAEAGGVVTDARGRRLDFSRGAKLTENEGVVASASPALHARVLAAVEAARAQGQGR
jgi:HAL2 family 3'(2'),5'-bisphosphate nucleotidase